MAKLVDVYRTDKSLGRRQLPLIVDENLTMVMDLNSMGLICDNKPVKGKELEEFTRKFELLSATELGAALHVTKSDMVRVLNQAVPCVGCRRSVERLYYQLFKCGNPTLDPLTVDRDGVITLRGDKPITASVLATLFHGHSSRLNNLVDSQPRRSKKSHRCLLHSLDSQRSRPITPAWRDVWECMRQQCKEEVVLIEYTTLLVTLENYLRKHRFCGECRTKVLRAYTLLIEEPEPCKEKGYVAALYSGIKRCLPDKHLHLQTKTDYISKLISRAEPELMGSRRERHAKTLEIAQEEVLTCLGICVYERLHRIYVRMREEECTCQVFAAVAVDTLCRSFETAVEMKQGISQLELLYEELTKEEQLKQQRKEQKKLKRRRKKEKLADEKENCKECEIVEETAAQNEDNKLCNCVMMSTTNGVAKEKNKTEVKCVSKECKGCKKEPGKKCNINGLEKQTNNWLDDDCKCSSTKSTNSNNNKRKNDKIVEHVEVRQCHCEGDLELLDQNKNNCKCFVGNNKKKQLELFFDADESDLSSSDQQKTCKCFLTTASQSSKSKKNKNPKPSSTFFSNPRFECEQDDSDLSDKQLIENGKQAAKETWSSSEHSNDCGYSSENNNGCCETTSGTSSLPSSPEGSELACSGSCCNLEGDCPADYKHRKFLLRGNNPKLTLEQMLEDSCSSDEEGEESYISAEEVREFQLKVSHLTEQREELRQTLRTRFAQLCVNGPHMQNIKRVNHTLK